MKPIPLIAILGLLLTGVVEIAYGSCYQALKYDDRSVVTSRFSGRANSERSSINGTLHSRPLQNEKGDRYYLFWLEDPEKETDSVDAESMNTPFLVSNRDEAFVMGDVKTKSLDRELHNKLVGLVELLQQSVKDGEHRWLNSIGSVVAIQTTTEKGAAIIHKQQWRDNKHDHNIEILKSEILVDFRDMCRWQHVFSENISRMDLPAFGLKMTARRIFEIYPSKESLSNNHWFFELGANVDQWDIWKKKSSVSKDQALELFEDELITIGSFNNNDEWNQWIVEHSDLLAYLPELLEQVSLDDEVSKDLFAQLGFINSVDSVDILSSVVLSQSIHEKERFRALMGLKNTSAPFSEEAISKLVDYGMDATNGEDFVHNATGMLLGTFAKERVHRQPEQWKQINERLSVAVAEAQGGAATIMLVAAGNMKDTVSPQLLIAVEDRLRTSENASIRRQAAITVSSIGRSNLTAAQFQEIWDGEVNSDAVVELIRASTRAQDVQGNQTYQQSLLLKLQDRKTSEKVRKVALDTLAEAGYGQLDHQRQEIRRLMIGEHNKEISKSLRQLYRRY